MAIINFYLNISLELKELINELIKYTSILIILNWLIINVKIKNPFKIDFLNKDLIILIILLNISIITYNLIIKKIIEIK
jgi:hypothetical protein